MIMTVDEFRGFYSTDETDTMLKSRIDAIESMIRSYTNNRFQARGFKQEISINNGVFTSADGLLPFAVGDTVELKKSAFNDGLYTIKAIAGKAITVNESTVMQDAGQITKIVYPCDVKMGAVNLLKWELERREKVGISAETIARHSVTYADMNGENSLQGYPKPMITFLYPYKRARFGGCK